MSVVATGRRTEEWTLRTHIHGSTDVAVGAIEKMITIHLGKIAQTLLTCSPPELDRLQGRAAAFAEVRKWIKEPLSPIDTSK